MSSAGTMEEACAPARATSAAAERTEYGVTGLRKIIYAAAFLILLPFFASLPAMLYHRIRDGLWFDTIPLALFSLVFAAVMAMLALNLLFVVMARVTFAKSALRFTLPVGLGPTPLLSYQTQDIPYHSIKGVELRREIYGAPLLPVLMRGAIVHTKDNRSITLGYSREDGEDSAIPFSVIAAQIARRAAVPLVEQRTIWRRPRAERALGYISEIDTRNYIVDPAEVEKINSTHRRLVLAIAGAVVTLFFLSLSVDL